ncbi:hypothetical protein CASFOL_018981 [Castilleja foliolosa]|uniref:Uncharacterized protein n=1 Tax=Castilleja foliolosa TaxID=1961234 RepID=A0ABD3D4P2_9LAMI
MATSAVSLFSLASRATPSSLILVSTCRATSLSTLSTLYPPPPLLLSPELKTDSLSPLPPALYTALTFNRTCSGCTHEYDLHLPPILGEAIKFFSEIGVLTSPSIVADLCCTKLAVRGSSMNPLIGLYEFGTHNAVDIPECQAHHPSINAAVVDLLKQDGCDDTQHISSCN